MESGSKISRPRRKRHAKLGVFIDMQFHWLQRLPGVILAFECQHENLPDLEPFWNQKIPATTDEESGVRSQESGAPHELCARGFEKKVALGGPRRFRRSARSQKPIRPNYAGEESSFQLYYFSIVNHPGCRIAGRAVLPSAKQRIKSQQIGRRLAFSVRRQYAKRPALLL